MTPHRDRFFLGVQQMTPHRDWLRLYLRSFATWQHVLRNLLLQHRLCRTLSPLFQVHKTGNPVMLISMLLAASGRWCSKSDIKASFFCFFASFQNSQGTKTTRNHTQKRNQSEKITRPAKTFLLVPTFQFRDLNCGKEGKKFWESKSFTTYNQHGSWWSKEFASLVSPQNQQSSPPPHSTLSWLCLYPL